MANQTLDIQILSCGGMSDLMSEQEAMFLNNCLPLFRNEISFGRATPRARTSMVRAYEPDHLLSAVGDHYDLLHLIAHADQTSLQVGKNHVDASTLFGLASQGKRFPKIVVSTACKFDSATWRKTLAALGVEILIAAKADVTPANLAAFDMAFYSALLSRVHKGKSDIERAILAFEQADSYYRSIHAMGAKFAKFSCTPLR